LIYTRDEVNGLRGLTAHDMPTTSMVGMNNEGYDIKISHAKLNKEKATSTHIKNV